MILEMTLVTYFLTDPNTRSHGFSEGHTAGKERGYYLQDGLQSQGSRSGCLLVCIIERKRK